jgi:prepilin-type N-terminal cleavage/methylation domain-containing protein
MITKNKGFSLIELLVVIAIIAVLTQVVIANMNDARKKSRDAKRISDVAQLQLALELYFNRCNAYPQHAASGNPLVLTTSNGCPSGITLGSFIPAIPTPPVNSAETYYRYVGLNTNCTDYHLGATLEVNNQTGPLKDDVDASANNTAAASCRTGTTDFAGTEPMYDVKP